MREDRRIDSQALVMEKIDPRKIVLFEDNAILVINKPSGLLSLRDGYDKTLPHLATLLSPVFGRLWMVHRLDRDTSGVMVVARTAASHHSLNDQFKDRRVTKVYHALVNGVPTWEAMAADGPLRKDGDRRHRTVIDPLRGKPAQTDFRVMERFIDYTLLEARPYTGYTHQIRAHAAWLGFPLAGDSLYGYGEPLTPPETAESGPAPSLILDRPALHAFSLTFRHPTSSHPVTFTAPYPDDFTNTLVYLRQSAP
jgi:RluA family pseudouridine synthase